MSSATSAVPDVDRRRQKIPFVDSMTDDELKELNESLPWHCFVLDSHGRQFGRPSSPTKRNSPQTIPDRRIKMLDERFGLKDLTVLEIGCFEGVHTIALCRLAKHVKACDSRVSNVLKTIVRCAMFDETPTTFVWNVEEAPKVDVTCDVMHHVGVLYHLLDPVAHLRAVVKHVSRGIMLDTHYAKPDQATHTYTSSGVDYRYKRFGEGGKADPFSGMYDTAKWLLLDDLISLLRSEGFSKVDVVEDRAETNGPRILIMAER